MLGRKEDVIVVGAGMAGLCASLAVLERGVRVITLEKGNRFGGSMALSVVQYGLLRTWSL